MALVGRLALARKGAMATVKSRSAGPAVDQATPQRRRSHAAHAAVNLWLLGWLGLWPLALLRSDALPPPERLVPALGREPHQVPTNRPPFRASVGGTSYTVEPLYDYDLVGLVVSENVAGGWWSGSLGFHRRHGDHLNVKDVCVVWGANALGGAYRRARFRSGEFTCSVWFPTTAAAAAFDPTALANNHLLSADDRLRGRLRALRRGDQIRLRGQLAAYGHNQGRPFRRGTSTRRDDTGNGACETLYVKELEVLRPVDPTWRRLARLAPLAVLAGAVAWLRLPLPRR